MLLHRPAKQFVQIPPASELYFPARQLEQLPLELDPAGLDAPAAHRFMQVAFEVAPTVALHLPGGQFTHSALLDKPVTLLNVPAGQFKAAEDPEGQ